MNAKLTEFYQRPERVRVLQDFGWHSLLLVWKRLCPLGSEQNFGTYPCHLVVCCLLLLLVIRLVVRCLLLLLVIRLSPVACSSCW